MITRVVKGFDGASAATGVVGVIDEHSRQPPTSSSGIAGSRAAARHRSDDADFPVEDVDCAVAIDKPMNFELPILEFDGEREALIEPSKVIKPIDIPECCVLPIYHTVIAKLLAASSLTHVTNIRTAMGPLPVYKMDHDGRAVTVAHPGLAAPLAAAVMEELIALGCRRFIACGSAGVLDASLAAGTVIVPSSAIRDEGTSYHYVLPGREISTDPHVVQAIESVLRRHGVKYAVGKTWTTDAFYRETRARIARRKAEGCLTVEMECSAFLAVAKFRNVSFGQLLGTGDDVSGPEWDRRNWGSADHVDFCDRLFWLAVDACVAL